MNPTPIDANRTAILLLRSQLLALFSPLLGVYQRPDGTTVPALHISPPDVPTTYRASGIECIIQEPEDVPHMLQAGGRIISNERNMIIIFVQHDKLHTLRDVKRLVVTQLTPQYIRGEIVYQPPNGSFLEQLTVRLYNPELIIR